MAERTGSRGPLLASVLVAAVTLVVPRWLVPAAPVLPDSTLYQYAGTFGYADPHLAFRYVSLVPIWFASLLSDDAFIVARFHGLLVGVLGIGGLLLLARALRLGRAETSVLLLLFAVDFDAISNSGWMPLTDVSFAVAVLYATAALLFHREGRCHPALVGAALACAIASRLTGGALLIALLALHPWKEGPRRIVEVLAWVGVSMSGYFVVAGLIVSGDPLWAFGAITEFAGYGLGQRNRPRPGSLAYAWLLASEPRLLLLVLVSIWAAVVSPHRLLPLVVVAACVLLALEALTAVSPRLRVRERRLVPVTFLLLPMLAVFTVGQLGALLAIGVSATVVVLTCIAIAWPEAFALPETILQYQPHAMLALLGAAALWSVRFRSRRALALAAALVLVSTAAVKWPTMALIQRSNATRLMTMKEPAGTCPLAIVPRAHHEEAQVSRLNRLVNGECATSAYAANEEEAGALDFRVAFSTFGQIPYSAHSRVNFEIHRFERREDPEARPAGTGRTRANRP